MNPIQKEELLQYLKHQNPDAKAVFIDLKNLVFEKEVARINCFYCGKYNNNWKCPPNLPDMDYEKMFAAFDEGVFVYLSYDITDAADYTKIRNESSVILHKTLLAMEKWMWNHNMPTAISFGAGSCKLCKGGCAKEKCNHPYLSRSPLEATGVNVLKSAKKYGINLSFPTDKKLYRLGLLIWQKELED